MIISSIRQIYFKIIFKDGLLSQEDLLTAKQGTPYFCEFDRLKNERVPLLIKASKNANEELKVKINEFIEENIHIKEFCKFMALKTANNEKEWTEWTIKEYSDEIYFGWCFILLFVIVQGFEQGGSEEVRKQFGELFLPTWATSVSEAIAHGSVRKNPGFLPIV